MFVVGLATRCGALRLGLLTVLGAATALSHPAAATDWYVDGKVGKSSNRGTAASPFLYFWQATQAAKPGDTVYVVPSIVYPHLSISVSGTATQPITFIGAGAAPGLTQIVGDSGHFAMWVNANYVAIRNFDLSAPGTQAALHVAENHHHITIANNVAHDSGGNGLSTVGDDYITISHNTVYGNAKNTSNNVFNSGISTLGNVDIDGNTGVKMVIDGNVVYGNTNTPTCPSTGCAATVQDSDGNGIIIDDLRRMQRDHVAYRGRTLISNNVVFGNGGRGIHIYLSDHVTATGNTVYYNNQDPYEGNYRPGEIEVLFASDVAVTNNILVSDGGVGIGNGKNTGTHLPFSVANCSGTGAVTFQNNLGYNPRGDQTLVFSRSNTVTLNVANNLFANPNFVLPSLNPTIADFRLLPGSPALQVGNAATATSVDVLGVTRTSSPVAGAFQTVAQ